MQPNIILHLPQPISLVMFATSQYNLKKDRLSFFLLNTWFSNIRKEDSEWYNLVVFDFIATSPILNN